MKQPSQILVCVCSDCKKEFRLSSMHYSPPKDAPELPKAFVEYEGSESDGLCEMFIDCPHCNHRHELY